MFGEVALVGEAKHEGDFRQAQARIHQQHSGPGDTALQDEMMRRHAGAFFEGMGEMMESKPGNSSQIRQRDVLGQMFLDMLQHPAKARRSDTAPCRSTGPLLAAITTQNMNSQGHAEAVQIERAMCSRIS